MPFKLPRIPGIHRDKHGSKNSPKTEAKDDRPGSASGPPVLAPAHKGNVSTPGQAPSSEESKQDIPLWDQAYAALDGELVEAYERLLSEELPTRAYPEHPSNILFCLT
jgi:hypothetical protein